MSNQQPVTPVPQTINAEVQLPQPVAAKRHKGHARDGAQYVRQQRGHSLLLNLFIVGPITMYITTVYYSVSKNHYWHL